MERLKKLIVLSIATAAGVGAFLLWVWMFPGVLRVLEGDPRADIDDQVLFVEFVGVLAATVCGASIVAGRLLSCRLVQRGEVRWWRRVFGAPAAFVLPLAAVVQWSRGAHFAAIVSTALALMAAGDLWLIYRVERAIAEMAPPTWPPDRESESPEREADR